MIPVWLDDIYNSIEAITGVDPRIVNRAAGVERFTVTRGSAESLIERLQYLESQQAATQEARKIAVLENGNPMYLRAKAAVADLNRVDSVSVTINANIMGPGPEAQVVIVGTL